MTSSHKLRVIVLSCSAMMIHGCAGEPKRPLPPNVVDVAPVRCNPLDPASRAVLARRVSRPRPDTPEGLSRAGARVWIDRLELEIERKIDAGAQLASEYDTCRNAVVAGS